MTTIPCVVNTWFCDLDPKSGVSRIRAHAEAEQGISVEIAIFDHQLEEDVVWDSLKNQYGISGRALPSYYSKLQRQIEELTGEESGLFHCWHEAGSNVRRYSFALRADLKIIEALINSQCSQQVSTLFQLQVPYLFDEAVSTFGHAIVTDYTITQKFKANKTW
jgi:hypothetical protein